MFVGGKPHDEREDAYAAMQKKQVVHLSKDSLNQFDQVSIQALDSTSASQPQVNPRPSATGASSQNRSHRRGAVSNNGEPSLQLAVCHYAEAGQPITNFLTRPLSVGTERFTKQPMTCSNAWLVSMLHAIRQINATASLLG